MAPYQHVLRDNRGQVIRPGLRVAYNLSGQIGVGVVREISAGSRHGHSAPTIKITPEHPQWAVKRGIESKVRDATSVLVLTPDEGGEEIVVPLVAAESGESAIESLLLPALKDESRRRLA